MWLNTINYLDNSTSNITFCPFITDRKRSLGQGNFFSSVCQEFCSRGESASVHAGIPLPQTRHTLNQAPPPGPNPTEPGNPLDQAPPGPGSPPDQAAPRTRHPLLRSACWEIRSTSGRYASYWNAILSRYFLNHYSKRQLYQIRHWWSWLSTLHQDTWKPLL